jgi:SHS2 domain-containing protein
MADFKVIEEGAFSDYEFEANADSLEELFAICGKATFEAMTDTSKVLAGDSIKFGIVAENLEDLMFAFLSELIYLKDTEKLFLSDFVINLRSLKGEYNLKCEAKGEHIDFDKHDLRTDVKAATYHQLAVSKHDEGYRAHVILDL